MSSKLSANKIKTKDQTHPYINRRQSQKQSFSSASTLSQETHTDSFLMSAKMLLPLVMRLKQQNQQLAAQKKKINDEMLFLNHTSHALLQQNQSLKQHYRNRSNDLHKIIGSIGINYGHHLEQTSQLIHSYKQHNSKLYRVIEEDIHENRNLQKQIQKMNNIMTKQMQKYVSKDKQSFQKTTQYKKVLNRVQSLNSDSVYKRIEQLQQVINSQLIQIHTIKHKNIVGLALIHDQKNCISTEKPVMKNKTVQQIKKVKSLRMDLQKLKIQLQRYNENIQQLSSQNQLLILSRVSHEQIYNAKLYQYNNFKLKNEEIISSIKTRVGSLKYIMKNAQSARYDKNKLYMQIRNRISKKNQKKSTNAQKMDEAERQKQRKLNLIKQNTDQFGLAIQNCQRQNWNPEKQSEILKLQELQADYDRINQNIQSIEMCINKQQNPIQQIITLSYKLSKNINKDAC